MFSVTANLFVCHGFCEEARLHLVLKEAARCAGCVDISRKAAPIIVIIWRLVKNSFRRYPRRLHATCEGLLRSGWWGLFLQSAFSGRACSLAAGGRSDILPVEAGSWQAWFESKSGRLQISLRPVALCASQ